MYTLLVDRVCTQFRYPRNYSLVPILGNVALSRRVSVTGAFVLLAVTTSRLSEYINSYLRHFKIRGTPSCPCGPQHQTVDHLLLGCELSRKERNDLTTNISKTNVWPISKSELITKHFKDFYKFTNDISFDKLTNSEPNRH